MNKTIMHYKIKTANQKIIGTSICGIITVKWIDDKEKFMGYKDACGKCKKILEKGDIK